MRQKTSRGARIRTFLIHGHARTRRWDYSHHLVPPQSASVAYRLDSAERGAKGFAQFASPLEDPERRTPIYIYDRLDEPDRSLLEDLIAHAEGGEVGVCFTTGMAAISAILGVLLRSGDHVIAHRTLYGCTYSLLTTWLPRMGIQVTFLDLTHPERLSAALTPQTRVILFETPCNPNMELMDIRAISRIARRASPAGRLKVVVDNTFATPFGQRPLAHGADVVVHSLTKGLSGFGTDMGGVVVGPRSLWHDLLLYRKDFGGVLAARSAWPIMVYGVSSLAVRMRAQQETAGIIARRLERHPAVEAVRYPGLRSFPWRALARRQMRDVEGRFAPGSLLYFRLRGTRRTALAFLDRLAESAYAVTLAVSLGQVRTLVEYPALMTHSALPEGERRALGVEETGIRLSLGLEDAQDIWADLSRALSPLMRSRRSRRKVA